MPRRYQDFLHYFRLSSALHFLPPHSAHGLFNRLDDFIYSPISPWFLLIEFNIKVRSAPRVRLDHFVEVLLLIHCCLSEERLLRFEVCELFAPAFVVHRHRESSFGHVLKHLVSLVPYSLLPVSSRLVSLSSGLMEFPHALWFRFPRLSFPLLPPSLAPLPRFPPLPVPLVLSHCPFVGVPISDFTPPLPSLSSSRLPGLLLLLLVPSFPSPRLSSFQGVSCFLCLLSCLALGRLAPLPALFPPQLVAFGASCLS